MLAEAACCFVCPTMLIEKTRLPGFESVVHYKKKEGDIMRIRMQLDIPVFA
jgi:hypothetical protein